MPGPDDLETIPDDARTRMLGAEHSQTLAAQGNNKEAISLLTEGLEIALRGYGKNIR